MSDVSDLLLNRRFGNCGALLNYAAEKQEDGSEIRYAAKRLGLLREDILNAQNSISEDRIKELVEAFRTNCLAVDDNQFAKLKVAGRKVLYSQLAEAYAFGLACFSRIYNREKLMAVLAEYGLHKHAKSLHSTSRYNKWNAITALLYGEWENVADDGGDPVLVYKRDRSAEKYACVLATLEKSDVKAANVVDFITECTMIIDGKKLKGILALETFYRQKVKEKAVADAALSDGPSPKQIAAREKARKEAIAKAENPANSDVFEFAKPAQLPEAIEFGRVTFKVEGKKLLVVGVEAWEQAAYEKHVIAKGKAMLKMEADVQAALDVQLEGVKESVGAVIANVCDDEAVADLLVDSAGVEDLTVAIKTAISDLAATRLAKQAAHFEQFADPAD